MAMFALWFTVVLSASVICECGGAAMPRFARRHEKKGKGTMKFLARLRRAGL
jgi:hypothetical protein